MCLLGILFHIILRWTRNCRFYRVRKSEFFFLFFLLPDIVVKETLLSIVQQLDHAKQHRFTHINIKHWSGHHGFCSYLNCIWFLCLHRDCTIVRDVILMIFSEILSLTLSLTIETPALYQVITSINKYGMVSVFLLLTLVDNSFPLNQVLYWYFPVVFSWDTFL